jgi:acyl carrier protein
MVKRAIVTTKEDAFGKKYLVAYIIPQEKSGNFSLELQNYLKTILPQYSIPNFFIVVDAFPLTSNGKLDYKNLPIPDKNTSQLNRNFIEPNTDLEKQLAKIWSKILEIETISIDDDFLQIGGDSLLVSKIIALIEENLGVQISPSIFFKRPNLAKLASYLEQLITLKNDPSEKQIFQCSDRPEKLLLSSAQKEFGCLSN